MESELLNKEGIIIYTVNGICGINKLVALDGIPYKFISEKYNTEINVKRRGYNIECIVQEYNKDIVKYYPIDELIKALEEIKDFTVKEAKIRRRNKKKGEKL
jgi:hypothetical protein